MKLINKTILIAIFAFGISTLTAENYRHLQLNPAEKINDTVLYGLLEKVEVSENLINNLTLHKIKTSITQIFKLLLAEEGFDFLFSKLLKIVSEKGCPIRLITPDDMNKLYSTNALGFYNSLEKVIFLKFDINKKNTNKYITKETCSLLMHELTHFLMDLLYDNLTLPYSKDDKTRAEIYRKAINPLETYGFISILPSSIIFTYPSASAAYHRIFNYVNNHIDSPSIAQIYALTGATTTALSLMANFGSLGIESILASISMLHLAYNGASATHHRIFNAMNNRFGWARLSKVPSLAGASLTFYLLLYYLISTGQELAYVTQALLKTPLYKIAATLTESSFIDMILLDDRLATITKDYLPSLRLMEYVVLLPEFIAEKKASTLENSILFGPLVEYWKNYIIPDLEKI